MAFELFSGCAFSSSGPPFFYLLDPWSDRPRVDRLDECVYQLVELLTMLASSFSILIALLPITLVEY